jgi:hypothetical protein
MFDILQYIGWDVFDNAEDETITDKAIVERTNILSHEIHTALYKSLDYSSLLVSMNELWNLYDMSSFVESNIDTFTKRLDKIHNINQNINKNDISVDDILFSGWVKIEKLLAIWDRLGIGGISNVSICLDSELGGIEYKIKLIFNINNSHWDRINSIPGIDLVSSPYSNYGLAGTHDNIEQVVNYILGLVNPINMENTKIVYNKIYKSVILSDMTIIINDDTIDSFLKNTTIDDINKIARDLSKLNDTIYLSPSSSYYSQSPYKSFKRKSLLKQITSSFYDIPEEHRSQFSEIKSHIDRAYLYKTVYDASILTYLTEKINKCSSQEIYKRFFDILVRLNNLSNNIIYVCDIEFKYEAILFPYMNCPKISMKVFFDPYHTRFPMGVFRDRNSTHYSSNLEAYQKLYNVKLCVDDNDSSYHLTNDSSNYNRVTEIMSDCIGKCVIMDSETLLPDNKIYSLTCMVEKIKSEFFENLP